MTITPITAAKSAGENTAPAALTLQTVNPADLGVHDQARGDATPDEQLVESVKRHGIMQPPIVAFDPEAGGYVIIIGHRRVGAAIVAGLTEISVLVRDDDISTDSVKLEEQIVENERRKGLTAAELAQGFKKFQLFGYTPAEIAAALGEKTDRVRAGLKINDSKAATQLVADMPAIDFEQAAIIADFDEHPKLQAKLIDTATTNPANFQRDVENQRTQREVDTRVAKLKAQLDEDNIPLADVVNHDVENYWSGKGVGPGNGRTLKRLGLSVLEHGNCPGHAAVIHRAQSYYLNEQPTDWLTYVCTDWEANGHAGTTPTLIEKSDEQLEREAEWERQKAENAARRQLIDANTRARRSWIHGYLTTGRLRPTATHFDIQADALALQIESVEPAPAHLTLELLTGEPVERTRYNDVDTKEDALAAVIDDPAVPNLRIIVATAIATFEEAIQIPRAVKYFDALAGWGYTLTDTDREHIAAAEAEAIAEQANDVDPADSHEDDDEDADYE